MYICKGVECLCKDANKDGYIITLHVCVYESYVIIMFMMCFTLKPLTKMTPFIEGVIAQ